MMTMVVMTCKDSLVALKVKPITFMSCHVDFYPWNPAVLLMAYLSKEILFSFNGILILSGIVN